MDISEQFRGTVRLITPGKKDLKEANNTILKEHRKRSTFFIRAKKIANHIATLKELLTDNRQAYLNVPKLLTNEGYIDDSGRDKIDSVAQSMIHSCLSLISELKSEASTDSISQQYAEHRQNVIQLIENYLHYVCQIYSEHRAIRVKKVLDLRKMSKLESSPDKKKSKTSLQESIIEKSSSEDQRLNKASSSMETQGINDDINRVPDNHEEQLSSEDIQIFEAENNQLYEELNTLTEEVKRIESKVVYIAELQEVFSKKVLDQDKNLERVLTTVVGSTENVREANEQIRKAIQRNAGLRVWVLFFLLVLSFTLIFLDWYNP